MGRVARSCATAHTCACSAAGLCTVTTVTVLRRVQKKSARRDREPAVGPCTHPHRCQTSVSDGFLSHGPACYPRTRDDDPTAPPHDARSQPRTRAHGARLAARALHTSVATKQRTLLRWHAGGRATSTPPADAHPSLALSCSRTARSRETRRHPGRKRRPCREARGTGASALARAARGRLRETATVQPTRLFTRAPPP